MNFHVFTHGHQYVNKFSDAVEKKCWAQAKEADLEDAGTVLNHLNQQLQTVRRHSFGTEESLEFALLSLVLRDSRTDPWGTPELMQKGFEYIQGMFRNLCKKSRKLLEDCRLTVDEISAMFPQLSRILLYETHTEMLGYQKV
ncbi:hypothetical protein J437_LFUL017621 [Ladona fulva]|uniref:Uncharacterized protein n=1 Tax=Ladona fulva TaxID=123851 RepID=A0A8K0K8Y0_LADFU|nr:hypothetical protein J437_LFUL017621 [Ladona fulva]